MIRYQESLGKDFNIVTSGKNHFYLRISHKIARNTRDSREISLLFNTTVFYIFMFTQSACTFEYSAFIAIRGMIL